MVPGLVNMSIAKVRYPVTRSIRNGTDPKKLVKNCICLIYTAGING
jgi:hypothetical protein